MQILAGSRIRETGGHHAARGRRVAGLRAGLLPEQRLNNEFARRYRLVAPLSDPIAGHRAR